jgi:hypothetical protein
MSWEVTGLISKRKLGSTTRRLLMLTMGDKANDDGSGVYASVPTLARDSEISESSVRRTIKEFIAEGLVLLVGQRECRNGYTNIYEIVLDAVDALPEIKRKPDTPVTVTPVKAKGRHLATPSTVTPVTMTPDPCHRDTPTPVTVTPKPILKPIKEPEDLVLTAGEERPSRRKPRVGATERTLPIELTPAMRKAADKAGYLNGSGESQFDLWRDWHLAKGDLIADFDASFRTWIANAQRFGATHNRKASNVQRSDPHAVNAGAAPQSTAFGGGRYPVGQTSSGLDFARRLHEAEQRAGRFTDET